MAFPSSPSNGQQATVNGITYQYTTTTNSWARLTLAFGNVTATGYVSAVGNVIGGNVTTVGLVSATGNITGGNIIGGTVVRAPVISATNGILINSGNVTANYTIATGTNGFSVGPITTNSGVVVTITSGQRWVII
jgi:hypothetical protein